MLIITNQIHVPDNEIEILAIHSGGPGGQHVNKVASAVQLKFNIRHSSLPAFCKRRLEAQKDRRITAEGIIVIQVRTSRSFHQNKQEALARLRQLILLSLHVPRRRKPTRPTRQSAKKRMDRKKKHGTLKELRKKVHLD